MSRFGSDPLGFFNVVYQNSAPWDIGVAQPAMVALIEKFPPANPILDLGCGSGDLAIYLARLGHQVLGVDFVESAIQNAREKVASLPDETAQLLRFQVSDARKPSSLGQMFGAVFDSGFYHLFGPDQGEQLIEEVAAILEPHGCYYLHEFAIEFQAPNVPRQISREELQTRFTIARGWRIKEIQVVEFLSRVAHPVPAICACIERLPV
ncbi:MAG TPA: class I SAM-dependent methyltransferase [Anaerolineales bacterium]|nr:class I SAM-dependent methyltransferase [Anaerolineales bacterium]